MSVILAGVDGCKAGWVAAVEAGGKAPDLIVSATFSGLIEQLGDGAIVAVDMPIGLPDRIGRGGRGPEQAIRPLLGGRQSSVFSIPSRTAVYAEPGPFVDWEAMRAARKRADRAARETSDPPRGLAFQAFTLFAKIREIDRLLLERPELRTQIFECHPELAFWRLNGERAMALPKKVKGRIDGPGMAERRALLVRCGLPEALVRQDPPAGAAEDDCLDAMACLMIARRHSAGSTQTFPDPPLADPFGIPICIRA
ncbi:hypothetical protein CSC94_00255 [Zhengella mangrovi]|uniref:DUF429 domain-containing protein n=1 Tax=Zhengella mangrovi TaxID=1982044 RepID=A0A2G1QTC7_9HYPH|nr:DUF429 domain-containing protein [Zhengella mangrovi]PHP68478.1 hypothetical protein CSC94_00255 [Zhengella mangrovi]